MKLEVDAIEYPGGDYEDDRMYMRVNKIYDVRIVKTDDGIAIDVWSYGSMGDPAASIALFDADFQPETEDEG